MTILTESPTTVFDASRGWFRAGTGRGPRHSPGMRSGCWWPRRAASATPRSATCPQHLRAGDVVVVNNSATVAGEIDAVGPRGPVVLHLATPLDDGTTLGRILEVRTAPDASRSVLDAAAGDRFAAGGIEVTAARAVPAARLLPDRPRQPPLAGAACAATSGRT